MRRALAILKYVPAVLCGLLVVAWGVSVPYSFSVARDGRGIGCEFGSIGIFSFPPAFGPSGLHALRQQGTDPKQYLGSLKFNASNDGYYLLRFPIPFLLTLLLPLAIGSCIRFRFPLWSYFAWTALVAAELAYYLR